MNCSKIEKWRKFLKKRKKYDLYDHIFETQIPNDKLTIEDIPGPQISCFNKLNYFALTYNTYDLNEFNESEELYEKYYGKENFDKNLKNLRSLLFFHQRKCHFTGPIDNREKKIFKDVITEIRKIFNASH